MSSKSSAAHRRYFLRLAAFLALYLALIVPIVWSHSQGLWPAGPIRYALAVLPALPVFGVIWSILRFVVEEEDEYLRFLHVQAVLIATGVTLCVCTAWGFLAAFAGVPAPQLMFVFVIFSAALFVGMGFISWRQR
jgi:hypothetical protein